MRQQASDVLICFALVLAVFTALASIARNGPAADDILVEVLLQVQSLMPLGGTGPGTPDVFAAP